jgi:hypothetical protein
MISLDWVYVLMIERKLLNILHILMLVIILLDHLLE